MDGTPDISKVIGLIMENPDIVQKIRTLADEAQSGTEDLTVQSEKTSPDQKNDTKPVEAVSAYPENSSAASMSSDSLYERSHRKGDKKRRTALLSALKPYLSSERSKAIDTMLSVIEVIDIMKVR